MRSKGFFYNLAGFVFEYFCDSGRILATFTKFCLNSLFATWSYHFTCHPARASSSSPPSPTQVFWRKKFLQNPPPSPNCYRQISLKRSPHAVFVRRLGNLVSAKKSEQGEGFVKFCIKKHLWEMGAWARAGWRVWDLGNGTIMLQKLFNPEIMANYFQIFPPLVFSYWLFIFTNRGNFQSRTWVWRKFAAENRVKVNNWFTL